MAKVSRRSARENVEARLYECSLLVISQWFECLPTTA